MKKLIVSFFFILFSLCVSAQLQQQSLGGSPTTLNTVQGGFWPKLYSVLPKKDTLNNPAVVYVGAETIRPQDTLISSTPPVYMSNGHYWFREGASGGGSGNTLDSIHVSSDQKFYQAYSGGIVVFQFATLLKTVRAGANITVSLNAAQDTITIGSTGGGGSSLTTYFNYIVRDSLNTLPATPLDSSRYLVGTVPTGVAVGHANSIALYDSASATYTFQTPTVGDLLYNATNVEVSQWTGLAWIWVGKPVVHTVTGVGVDNTDPLNPVITGSGSGGTLQTDFDASVLAGDNPIINIGTDNFNIQDHTGNNKLLIVPDVFTGLVYDNNNAVSITSSGVQVDGNLTLDNVSSGSITDSVLTMDGVGVVTQRSTNGIDDGAFHTATQYNSNSFSLHRTPTGSDSATFNFSAGITPPNTTLNYLTGFNTYGSLYDSVRGAITLTTTGNFPATYSSVTGILNIPTPSTLYWGLNGNTAVVAGSTFFGTTDSKSVPIKTNGIIRMVVDSVGKVFIDSAYFGRGTGKGYNKSNLAAGDSALGRNTTGTGLTAYGDSSLTLNTTGNLNTSVGFTALQKNTTGSGNTAVGNGALLTNSTAGNNTAFGQDALRNNNASNNTGLGQNALKANNSGTDNTGVGLQALLSNTSGTGNTAVGENALVFNDGGGLNTAIGLLSLFHNTSGGNNIGIGWQANSAGTTASFNIAIGNNALVFNSSGQKNTAIGFEAMDSTTSGQSNTAVGYQVMHNNTTGIRNVAVGEGSFYYNTTGQNNIAIGSAAGTFIGDDVTYNTASDSSTFIGYRTHALAVGQRNQIVIGSYAYGLGSNTAVIGNSNIVTTGVWGNLALQAIGNKLIIPTGTNASVGTSTLSSGIVTVSTTAVSSSSLIFVVYNTPSGTLASGLSAPTGSIVNGTSFVINSLTTAGIVNTLDNSTVRWIILN